MFLFDVFFFFFLAMLTACGILVPQPEIELRSLQWKHRVLTIRLPGNSWVQKFSNLVFIIFIWQFQHLQFLLPAVSTFSHLLCFVYLCLCYLRLKAIHFSWTFFSYESC